MNADFNKRVRSRLSESLEMARAGDAARAVEVAMLTHLFTDIASEHGLNTEYDRYLTLGSRTSDPELLVSIGEALFDGKLLARDVLRAIKFYFEADRFSPYMGAFMIARLDVYFYKNRKVGRHMLQKAINVGHVSSAILRDRLLLRRIGPLKVFWRPVIAIIVTWRIIKALRDKTNLYAKFWRYQDVYDVKRGTDIIAKHLSKDRVEHFQLVKELLNEKSLAH